MLIRLNTRSPYLTITLWLTHTSFSAHIIERISNIRAITKKDLK